MITVYGIKTCDTCRKAMKWLEAEGIDARFHDFRADGLDPVALDAWIGALGLDTVLNRRGTTWRKLPESATASADDARARALMLEHPALIKRPVFDLGAKHGVVIGFRPAEQEKIRATLS
jgi:Spx/MgsR family transcriptional regulator